MFNGDVVLKLSQLYRRSYPIIIVLIFVAALWYAYHEYPLLVDDSFISFRYAKNLVDGHGLVWNPGERVEGYSNFLWVMLYALGFKLGIQPEVFTYLISIPIYLASLVFSYLLALRVLKSRDQALVVLLLVAFNHSLAGFAGSGMETPLHTLQYVLTGYLCAYSIDHGWSPRRTLALSIILNLSLLTRPDGAILIVCATWTWLRTHRKKIRPVSIAVFLVPFLLIVLPWLIWKQSYYGTILPNSFNAKVRSFSGLGFGVYYLYLFVLYYTLLPYLMVVVWRAKTLVADNASLRYLSLIVLAWSFYTLVVGGDFMEFRFLAPVISFLMILIIAALNTFIRDRRVFAAVVLALCIGTVNNFTFMSSMFYSYRVERVEKLRNHVYAKDENWEMIGKKLKDLFGGTDVCLGLGAAGAIPYYSGLKSIDFMGLTDKTVPRIGEPFSSMPGHRIIAPLEYMVNSNVNLIVQPIQLMFYESDFRLFRRLADWKDIYKYFMDVDKPVNGTLLSEAILLGIPIEKGYYLAVWYLTPHEAIDRAISEHSLPRIKVVR